ncbi:MAG: DUF2330 domain-containing protein, partial [Actinomycetota bacterium]
MRKLFAWVLALTVSGAVAAGPALACGGLVASNGSIDLERTSTLAAYVDGVEHYVTAFEFQGGGAEFGSIIPLPGVPTDVKRAGDWTLQRLVQEVTPVVADDAGAESAVALGATRSAEVLLETEVDALDITVLKGGGDEVGVWAKENGFQLPPDAPEVLDFYADRSPIFMAARFDVARAEASGQATGDGTPIHLTIPTPNPWVPLRILGLGRAPGEIIEADVFLLTEAEPNLLPAPTEGVSLERSETASDLLLSDLRSDVGMKWLPTSGMHLSYLKIDAPASQLNHDLAIDATGTTIPSYVAAGLNEPATPWRPSPSVPWGLI